VHETLKGLMAQNRIRERARHQTRKMGLEVGKEESFEGEERGIGLHSKQPSGEKRLQGRQTVGERRAGAALGSTAHKSLDGALESVDGEIAQFPG
jgi:hypothetical protein